MNNFIIMLDKKTIKKAKVELAEDLKLDLFKTNKLAKYIKNKKAEANHPSTVPLAQLRKPSNPCP